MMTDEIIAILADCPDGLTVPEIARALEPKACGARVDELFYLIDKECMRLTYKGTLQHDVADGLPLYRMVR